MNIEKIEVTMLLGGSKKDYVLGATADVFTDILTIRGVHVAEPALHGEGELIFGAPSLGHFGRLRISLPANIDIPNPARKSLLQKVDDAYFQASEALWDSLPSTTPFVVNFARKCETRPCLATEGGFQNGCPENGRFCVVDSLSQPRSACHRVARP